MRWPFISGNLTGFLQFSQFVFNGFQPLLQPGNVLLLPEYLRIKIGDGFVL